MYLESLDSTAGRVVAGTEAHRGPKNNYTSLTLKM